MSATIALQYAAMCLIWGLSWIAVKTGVEAVPPLFFAAARFLMAGALMAAMVRWRGMRIPPGLPWRRVLLAGVLINTGCYATMFWGLQFVPSGFAAVINLSLMPIALFSLGMLFGQERFTKGRVVAIALGVVGLLVLMRERLAVELSPMAVPGAIAVIASTFSYALGSVLSKPLLARMPSLALASVHNVVGGVGLALLSLAFEDVGVATFRAFFSAPVLTSYAFLVLCGSLIAFTVYLKLLRDWGPYKAGTYAFVSPIIAVAVGMAWAGERYSAFELVGGVLMLVAVAMSLRPARAARDTA